MDSEQGACAACVKWVVPLLVATVLFLALQLELVPGTRILVQGLARGLQAAAPVWGRNGANASVARGAKKRGAPFAQVPISSYNFSGLVAPSDRLFYGAVYPPPAKKKKGKAAAPHYRVAIGILTGNNARGSDRNAGGDGDNTPFARRGLTRSRFRSLERSATVAPSPSCPNAFDTMNATAPVALRDPRFLYRFITVGGTLSQPDDIGAITREAEAERDLLIFQGLKEGYFRPGPKFLRFFHWLEDNVDAGLFTYDFVTIADDDTFIRLPALLAGASINRISA